MPSAAQHESWRRNKRLCARNCDGNGKQRVNCVKKDVNRHNEGLTDRNAESYRGGFFQ